jgi:hypothetical protein
MRARVARGLVRHVSRAIDSAYCAHVLELWISEAYWSQIACRRQRWAFPLARLLDRSAMGAQMAEECWWG